MLHLSNLSTECAFSLLTTSFWVKLVLFLATKFKQCGQYWATFWLLCDGPVMPRKQNCNSQYIQKNTQKDMNPFLLRRFPIYDIIDVTAEQWGIIWKGLIQAYLSWFKSLQNINSIEDNGKKIGRWNSKVHGGVKTH